MAQGKEFLISSFEIRHSSIAIRFYLKPRIKHFKSWSWSHPGPLCLCRLDWAYSRLCWVSLHSNQPTFCRCYCQMRNPTTSDFGTEPQKFLFQLIWPLFWPAATLAGNQPRPKFISQLDWSLLRPAGGLNL